MAVVECPSGLLGGSAGWPGLVLTSNLPPHCPQLFMLTAQDDQRTFVARKKLFERRVEEILFLHQVW